MTVSTKVTVVCYLEPWQVAAKIYLAFFRAASKSNQISSTFSIPTLNLSNAGGRCVHCLIAEDCFQLRGPVAGTNDRLLPFNLADHMTPVGRYGEITITAKSGTRAHWNAYQEAAIRSLR
jgi:hypothetical protein